MEENNLSQNLVNNQSSDDADKKKPGRKSKDDSLGNVQVLEYPNRTIPKIFEELLEKGFNVILAKDGYYVSGFYGLNQNTFEGFAFAQDTSEPNTLVFYDAKNNKHLIRNFEDLVFFNSAVWGHFFKVSDKFKKPDSKWFGYMLEFNALNISPK